MKALARRGLRVLSALVLATMVTYGLALANVHRATTASIASQTLPATNAEQVIGGSVGGCGILVGAIGTVIALGVAGETLGFGAALVASATIHVGAILCAT